ncbi:MULTISPECIES: terminase small subunit [unclassified Brucella]|uniref:terminase small subunit n=1 Tax=unclassified Brucella TaxID=2632610 RepID=UPI0012ADBA22|nr:MULTISPECIES: terminase small subunit [unclassified Brucella]MRN43451.1 terminase small subunit [Brucella sp. 09RB8913]MRN59426.1 terminase small subunit [Brucella sp. 09RB8918]MRN67979.1 terminase small subunit [Brucella sp. 10RB9213]
MTKTTAAPKKPGKARSTPEPRELNMQMQTFCSEYMKDMNATQAAIRAGYSEKTARQQGSRLCGYAVVQDRLQELHKEMRARIAMDTDTLIKELSDENWADLLDIHDDNNCIKPIREWPRLWRIGGLIVGLKKHERFEKDGDGNQILVGYDVEVKVSDKVRRKELLGKHLGAWKEKVEIDLSNPMQDLWNQIAGRSFAPKEN